MKCIENSKENMQTDVKDVKGLMCISFKSFFWWLEFYYES